ncbi:hypothetical protein [Phyllobacterium salinisoli]|nr:hypothetical protein [Phyllobacterium salinisoli]
MRYLQSSLWPRVTSRNGPRYRRPEFEFHVIDIAAEIAEYGAFIVP